MKFLSWDTNKRMIDKMIEFLLNVNSDILLLQEIRSPDVFSEINNKLVDYFQIWNNVGYGMAILSRSRDMKNFRIDFNGRVMTLEFENFYVVNVLAPSSIVCGSEEYTVWHKSLRRFLNKLQQKKNVIVGGNFYIRTNIDNIPFIEANAMNYLLKFGFVDTFKELHPEDISSFTYQPFNESNNRIIDYFFISENLKEKLTVADIFKDTFGSSHCPIIVELDI